MTGTMSNSQERIRSFVERAERLQGDISLLREDMKELFAEAKGEGFDTKALKRIIALRKKDREKLAQEVAILQLYAAAMGMEDVFA